MKSPAAIRVGTSGWSYQHWKGPFYPQDISDERMLEHYAERLPSVEINNSFYHLPQRSTLEQWRRATPDNFVFSVKASRYITHMKKLKDPGASVARFLERIETLGDKLGPILFQLPPRWSFNEERLTSFLQCLSTNFEYAFEFRDQRWLNEKTYSLLTRHKAALCIYDLDGFLSPKRLTAGFVYVRLHGPSGYYEGNYGVQTLAGWAGAFSTWASQGHSIYCYFDNDQAGYAALNAVRLWKMIG
jgi:uncharacterized protein YecE (DUF72 family)